MTLARAALFGLAALLTACGAAPKPPAVVQTPRKGTIFRLSVDPRVGAYLSSGYGFHTSGYFIEGPDGLILIDTQFTPALAEDFVTAAEALTGKAAKLAVVLHANPDKFNGTAVFQKRGIKVVTSAQVAALIPAVHAIRHGKFYDDHKPDYPNEAPEPDVFGDATTTLRAAGLEITAHVMGPACSKAHVVVTWQGHAFLGDMLANGSHAWLEIGRSDAWLERLDEVAALKPEHLHPGRGRPGGPWLLDAQRAYLKTVQRIIGETKAGELDAARARIERAYPDHKYRYFLVFGVPAEWRRVHGGK